MTNVISAEELMSEGSPVDALQRLALQLNEAPEDEIVFEATCRALIASLEDQGSLSSWDKDDAENCYRLLLTQAACPTRPLVLAHQAASNITSGNKETVRRLLQTLTPTLESLIREDPAQVPGFKNVVIFTLTTRGFVDKRITQRDISDLHFAWFEEFDRTDLAPPYSVMFNADSFGKNRDELLAHYWGRESLISPSSPLRLWHLLFFEWLAGRDYFTAPDNSDLYEFFESRLPGNDDDFAAARMLLARHWRPAGQLSAERLTAFGFDEEFTTFLKSLVGIRNKLPDRQPTRRGAQRLENVSYQGLQAGLQIATNTIPFIRRRQDVRAAICVSGQLRGYKTALESWRRTLLQNINATFFVHSWKQVGRSDAQPFRYTLPFSGKHFPEAYRQVALAIGYETMRKKYPSLFADLTAEATVEEDTLKALYDTDHVILEDDQAQQYLNFSNQDKMHYKIHAAAQMAKNHGDFDIIVRIRPDLEVKYIAFNWYDLIDACKSRPILFAEKPFGLHYANLMIGDQCAIASPEVMDTYCNTWRLLPKFSAARLAGYPSHLTGHVSLALSAWLQGVDVKKAPIRFGNLQEAQPLSSIAILASLEMDSCSNEVDLKLIDSVQRDLREGHG